MISLQKTYPTQAFSDMSSKLLHCDNWVQLDPSA